MATKSDSGGVNRRRPRHGHTSKATRQAVINSALWAAWADAVGFIAELTDDAGLRRRTQSRPLTEPMPWKRRVGGKFGVTMQLPAGCYSDDTQLRLATARAITSRGFDVEAFAKVELPIWPTYALGGGRASKAAAANLSKSAIPWFGNFYDGYTHAGGNGVAMRIQPHVWAAPPDTHEFVVDILRNGITSHGHPRALVGAVLQGLALVMALNEQTVPHPSRWPELLDQTRVCVELIDDDTQLSLWRHVWEQHVDSKFDDLWFATVDECHAMLEKVQPLVKASMNPTEEWGRETYAEVVAILRLADPETRGSGTATVCAALAMASAFPDDPYLAALIPATTIDTDTDTIATMVGAICGATAGSTPPGIIQDLKYHEQEAGRLWHLRTSRASAADFAYPDLLRWTPPRSQIEAVGVVNDTLAISGLALLTPVEELKSVSSKDAVWLWTDTDFGQSMLIKMRKEPRDLPKTKTPPESRYITRGAAPTQETTDVETQLVLTPAEDVDPRPVDPFASPGLQRVDDTRTSDTRPPPQAGRRSTSISEPMPGSSADDAAGHSGASTSSPGRSARGSTEVPGPTSTTSRGDDRRLDVDEMLRWVWQRELSDVDIGYALRRIAESGTVEQLIAFSTSVRGLLERKRSSANE